MLAEISPSSLFSDRSKICKPESEYSVSGIVPVNPHCHAESEIRFVSADRSGIVPPMAFSERFKYFRLLIPATPAGKPPVN